MFDFIKTLNESKMIKGQESLKNFSARDCADLAFTCVLTLQILHSEENGKEFAAEYAHKILMFDDVDSFRLSGNDLYTLMFVLFGKNNNSAINHLKNQEDSLALLKTLRFDYTTFRKWLEAIISQDLVDNDKFLLSLESDLNIRDSNLRSIRRAVCDWNNLDNNEKADVIDLLTETYTKINAEDCDLVSVFFNDEDVNEMASCGSVGAGAIGAIPQPMFSQPLSRLPLKTKKKTKKSSESDK